MRVRPWAALIIVVGAIGAYGRAVAQPASLAVTWEAPLGCPDETYVRGEVERLLSGGPRSGVPVQARAVVGRSDTGKWRVALVTVREGTTGERTLEAASCRSLADATALIIALTIDPARVAANRPIPATSDAGSPESGAAAGESPSATPTAASTSAEGGTEPPDASAAPTPSATVAPTSTATPTSPSAERPGWPEGTHVSIFPNIGADVGTLPAPGYGLSLAAALLVGPVRLEGYGAYWPAQTARFRLVDGGDIRLSVGGLRVCYALLRSVVELAPCLGLELGDMHGQGFGVRNPHTADGLWVAGSLGGRASVRIAGPVGFSLDVGAYLPFRRDQFVLDQLGAIHQPATVEGRAIGGPEVRF